MVLSREQLFLSPMVTGPVESCSDEQYQPNGIDLTIAKIETFRDNGILSVEGKYLPSTGRVKQLRDNARWFLPRGEYLITFNETINLPDDIMAYILPRSSLLRMGVSLHGAVWDAGYHGVGSSLLVVYNESGWVVEKDARVAQLVFHRLEQPTGKGYAGSYQSQGLPRQGGVEIRSPFPPVFPEFPVAAFDIPVGATIDGIKVESFSSRDGDCEVTIQRTGDTVLVTDVTYDEDDDTGNPSALGLCYDRCIYCSSPRECHHASAADKREAAEIDALRGKYARIILTMPAEDYPDFKRYQVEDAWSIENAHCSEFPWTTSARTADGARNFDRQVAAMGEAIKASPTLNRSQRALAERYGQLPLIGIDDSETDQSERVLKAVL